MDQSTHVNPMELSEGVSIPGYISSRLMAAFNLGEHTVHVERVHSIADGRVVWHYVLERDSVVIFDAADMSTHRWASWGEAAGVALGFLALRPGDVEEEFFENYTEDQLAWRDEYAEELASWL